MHDINEAKEYLKENNFKVFIFRNNHIEIYTKFNRLFPFRVFWSSQSFIDWARTMKHEKRFTKNV